MKSSIIGIGLIVTSALFDSFAAFIVKLKFNEMGAMDYTSFRSVMNYMWNFIRSPILLAAVVTFVAAPALWFLALNKVDLSVGYPVMVCFHLVFVMLLGVFFLHEGLTLNKVIGTVLIFISLYLFYKS